MFQRRRCNETDRALVDATRASDSILHIKSLAAQKVDSKGTNTSVRAGPIKRYYVLPLAKHIRSSILRFLGY
jgi:hypothetical protein